MWPCFPALPLPKLHPSNSDLSPFLGLVPLWNVDVKAAPKEQFSNVFIGESEEVSLSLLVGRKEYTEKSLRTCDLGN